MQSLSPSTISPIFKIHGLHHREQCKACNEIIKTHHDCYKLLKPFDGYFHLKCWNEETARPYYEKMRLEAMAANLKEILDHPPEKIRKPRTNKKREAEFDRRIEAFRKLSETWKPQ